MRQHKLQIAGSDCACTGDMEACVGEHSDDFFDCHVTMAVKVRQQAMPGLWPSEIDDEDPPARLQDSSHFACEIGRAHV